MVDRSKRKTCLSIGGMLALPFVPHIATASTEANDLPTTLSDSDSSLQAVSDTNSELDILLQLDGEPVMRVTNTSNRIIIVRRISPSVVHAGDKSYDLNHSLYSSAYGIGAGRTRLIPIREERSFHRKPRMVAKPESRPLRVASLTADNMHGRILESARVFFS